jgi:hypothetical protein
MDVSDISERLKWASLTQSYQTLIGGFLQLM